MPWLTAEQMAEVDRAMVQDYGILLPQMMELAGRHLADLARERFLAETAPGHGTVILAGKGGNGGGALVAARPAGGMGNQCLVVLQPRAELWAKEARHDVLDRVQQGIDRSGVHAQLTGMHPTAVEAAESVAASFERVSLWTVLAVVIVLFLRFRQPRTVVLVLFPALFGAVWVAAVFSLTGQRLNLMNLGVIPMVLALGIDDGIHIVAPYLAGRRRTVDDVLKATGTGVLLTSLTTMVTFGSLGFSANRGLASVGLLSFIGIGCCLFASVVALPVLLESSRALAAGRSGPNHDPPMTRGSQTQT